jgi:hypothetical protein
VLIFPKETRTKLKNFQVEQNKAVAKVVGTRATKMKIII